MKPLQIVLPILFLAALSHAAELPPPYPPAAPFPPPPVWVAPQHLIDINPAALLSGELSLEYEQALGSVASILIAPDALLFRGLNSWPADFNARGGALKVGLHLFTGGNPLNGFWMGPEVIGTYAIGREGTRRAEGGGVSFLASLGYTFIVADHLSLGLGLGAGYSFETARRLDDGETLHRQGLALSGRLAIGYAF